MIPMLPIRNSCPIHQRMMYVPPMMVPMGQMPMGPAPVVCPPSNVNMSLSTATTTTTDNYDSYIYGRIRHVDRNYPNYRHIPFDWYRPPKQNHNIIHEDAAIITLDGPISLDQFHRGYIHNDIDIIDSDSYDDYNDSTSYYSDESDFDDDDDDEEDNRSPIIPSRRIVQFSNYSSDDHFDDTSSIDSTYAN